MSVTVMLVDDSSAVRLVAKRALDDAGFSVVEAEDGIDALEKLHLRDDVALIVCDVNMPRMNGIEFVESLAKEEGRKPAVLMVTTEGHPDLLRRAKACGVRGWMVKPFKPELLVATARRLTSTP